MISEGRLSHIFVLIEKARQELNNWREEEDDDIRNDIVEKAIEILRLAYLNIVLLDSPLSPNDIKEFV